MIGTRNRWAPFYPKERPVLADLIVSGAIEEQGIDFPDRPVGVARGAGLG